MGNFSNIFKSLRQSFRMTQDELATKLGVSRSTIGMYETGAREPDFSTMEAIADIFNVDIDYLYGRTNKTTLLPESMGRMHGLSSREHSLVKNYRQLNDDGQDYIDETMDNALHLPKYFLHDNSMQSISKQSKTIQELSSKQSTLSDLSSPHDKLKAAHSIPNASEADKKHDDDIMDDPNF